MEAVPGGASWLRALCFSTKGCCLSGVGAGSWEDLVTSSVGEHSGSCCLLPSWHEDLARTTPKTAIQQANSPLPAAFSPRGPHGLYQLPPSHALP